MIFPHGRIFIWIVQAAFALSLVFIPVWSDILLSKDSAFHNAASEVRALKGYIAFGLVVILSPQLVLLVWICVRRFVGSAYLSVYALRRGKIAPVAILGGCYILFVVGLANFVLGALNLGFSIAREVKYASSINSGRLIEMANKLQETHGTGSNLSILQNLAKVHPDNYNISRVVEHVKELENGRALSNEVMLIGDRFKEQNKQIMAIEAYKASIEIWPMNVEANDSLSQIQAQFAERIDDFRLLFDGCKNNLDLSKDVISRALPYVFRNPESMTRALLDGAADLQSEGVGDAICRRVVQNFDGDAFIASLTKVFPPG